MLGIVGSSSIYVVYSYYRGAGGVVYVFSTTDLASFEALPRWREKVEAECPDAVMILVQVGAITKCGESC